MCILVATRINFIYCCLFTLSLYNHIELKYVQHAQHQPIDCAQGTVGSSIPLLLPCSLRQRQCSLNGTVSPCSSSESHVVFSEYTLRKTLRLYICQDSSLTNNPTGFRLKLRQACEWILKTVSPSRGGLLFLPASLALLGKTEAVISVRHIWAPFCPISASLCVLQFPWAHPCITRKGFVFPRISSHLLQQSANKVLPEKPTVRRRVAFLKPAF